MSIEFRMPSLGADMEYGILTEWKIAPGDVVQRGDVVAVIETQKGAIDVEIFDSGKVEKLVVEPGAKVPVGEVLALLEGEGQAAAGPTTLKPAAPAAAPIVAPMTPPPATPGPVATRHKISPAARARAQQLKVDLDAVTATGPHDTITLQDVEAAATPVSPPASGGMREVIAAAMARSKREIPHYYLSLLVDYTTAHTWLEAHNASAPITERMLPVVPLIKAVALASQQVEGFNGYCIDGKYQPSAAVHLGVAIAQRGGGLVTPAVLDAHSKSLIELMQSLSDLVSRTRSGHLKSSELSAGTLTLTSLGEESVDAVMPIIYPPQVAIIGAGAIEPRPWAIEGRVESRMTVQLSLAADHRVSDGRTGARFLRRIRDLLQTPEKL